MSFITELYRVKLIISVVTLVNFLSILIISYILFSPKTLINLPKCSTEQPHKTNGYHKTSITEYDEEEEEEDIEVYGPSHLLLNDSSNTRN